MRLSGLMALVLLGANACDGGDSTGGITGDGGGAAVPDGGASPFSESCTTAGLVGRPVRMLTSDNAAELAGVSLGAAGALPGLLRRSVAVNNLGLTTALTMGAAVITQRASDQDNPAIFIPVSNPGVSELCFVKATGIRWLDASGAPLTMEAETFLTGAVGSDGARLSDTCLGPGDLGYLISAFPSRIDTAPLFPRVSSIEVSLDPGRNGEKVAAGLVPTQYTRCGQTRQFEVVLESRGPEAVGLWDDVLLGVYILADQQGPLDWGFLGPRAGLGVYPAGKTLLVGAGTFYDGAADRLDVYARFDVPTPSAGRSGREDRGLVERWRADRERPRVFAGLGAK